MSTQVPATAALDGCGPAYVADVHDAIPENELPANEKETGALYQPLASGGRDGAAVAVGEESSTFMK